jgi:methyl-accepting chemotaxis protein
MDLLNNLKVRTKLFLLVFLAMAALFGLAGTAYYFLGVTHQTVEDLYKEKLLAIEYINDGRAQIRKAEADMYALMATDDPQATQLALKDLEQRSKAFDTDMEKFSQLPMADADRAKFQTIQKEMSEYRVARDKVVALAANNQDKEAFALFLKDGKAKADQATDDLSDFSKNIQRQAEQMYQESGEKFAFCGKTFAGVFIVMAILLVLAGWIIVRQISGRLDDFVQYFNILATGDFSQKVSQSSLDDQSEFGTVSRAVEKMKEHIRSMTKQVADTAQQLAASSQELTANSEQSAQASQQVADSVAKVAAGAERQLKLADRTDESTQQITSAIQQVAANTETVSRSAEKTAQTANDGEASVQEAVSQMTTINDKTKATANVIAELEEKSKQIGQIVDVISSIAGQTNLLALNAAIEAARAGEAGRGFAVVAEEVRKLAEQSEGAAKQITELIHDVQTGTDKAVTFMNDGKAEVETGTQVVSAAGNSFQTILSMVRKMTQEIHAISASVQEISSGAQGVVESVDNMEKESRHTSEQTQTISAATEEQSASVEEIASASEQLAKMAENLQKEMQKFKV